MEKPKASVRSRAFLRSNIEAQNDGKRDRKGKQKDVGKLARVLNVPLDVFYEIMSHLHPVDLLQLARTSKELREHLLSRNSRHLWIAARRNVEPPLPDCPHDLSEPHLAHLVFERTCDACGVGRSVNVDYAVAVRLCRACWDENVLKGRALANACGMANLQGSIEILSLLPKAGGKLPNASSLANGVIEQTAKNAFYLPEFKVVVQQYQQLLLDDDDENALKNFVDERKASTLRRLNFQLMMESWEQRASKIQRSARHEVMAERRAAIMEKLGELGYSSSEIPELRYDIRVILDQPRKLTPRIWCNIKPTLVDKLEEERERVAQWEFRTKWQKRRAQFERHYKEFSQEGRETDERKRTLPSFVDILPRINDLLTANEPDVDVSAEEVAAMSAVAFTYREQYLAEARSALAEVIRRATLPGVSLGHAAGDDEAKDTEDKSDEEADLALLELPTSIFRCTLRSWQTDCIGAKSWLTMVEHWSQCKSHAFRSLAFNLGSVEYTDIRPTKVAKLAKALGLPADAEVPVILDAIKEGQPECTCLMKLPHRTEENLPFDRFTLLLDHVDADNRWSFHQITFTPISATQETDQRPILEIWAP
ncbi:hypothetical protein FKP32DRAFT_1682052 [Trametes sanguinea]|nr:hypothetical protein FKP32DRAFT_1682052 [Trametes sanguinea]